MEASVFIGAHVPKRVVKQLDARAAAMPTKPNRAQMIRLALELYVASPPQKKVLASAPRVE